MRLTLQEEALSRSILLQQLSPCFSAHLWTQATPLARWLLITRIINPLIHPRLADANAPVTCDDRNYTVTRRGGEVCDRFLDILTHSSAHFYPSPPLSLSFSSFAFYFVLTLPLACWRVACLELKMISEWIVDWSRYRYCRSSLETLSLFLVLSFSNWGGVTAPGTRGQQRPFHFQLGPFEKDHECESWRWRVAESRLPTSSRCHEIRRSSSFRAMISSRCLLERERETRAQRHSTERQDERNITRDTARESHMIWLRLMSDDTAYIIQAQE